MELIRMGIYLTKNQVRRFKALAKREASSTAWLIRKALNEYLERQDTLTKR